MFRISKITDYGIVLLTHFAQGDEGQSFSARQLARDSEIPLPTVGKILKLLSRAELLVSQRGVNGGYRLAKAPHQISAAEIIGLFEGPIALTDCTDRQKSCGLQQGCPARGHWTRINRVMFKALEGLTLADMSDGGRRGVAQ